MIGVVLVTHPHLGNKLIGIAESICGKIPALATVSIDTKKGIDELRGVISKAIKSVDAGKGVLLISDMLGGTPSNMSMVFLKEGEVEVITGLNLPMLITISNCRNGKSLKELAEAIKYAGRKNINLGANF